MGVGTKRAPMRGMCVTQEDGEETAKRQGQAETSKHSDGETDLGRGTVTVTETDRGQDSREDTDVRRRQRQRSPRSRSQGLGWRPGGQVGRMKVAPDGRAQVCDSIS